MYKLIAIDMDGTILKDDKTLSGETCRVIKKAHLQGIKIVLATGRPMKGIEQYLKELNLVSDKDYAVTLNGGVVQNIKTKEKLFQKGLSHEDLMLLYDISLKLKLNIHAFTSDTVITPKITKYTQLEADLNFVPIKVMDFKNLDKSIEIIKILMVEEPIIIEGAITKLPSYLYDKYNIVKSAPFFLEFLNKSVDKGIGVELLAKSLNIKQEEVIGIGDAGNDIHMIKYAGLGVAMGNAFEEVKGIADYVTLTNEEDGVAHVIKKFVLAV
jgi:Cof subfamily protein (haloacid dehalogenase superfamily)